MANPSPVRPTMVTALFDIQRETKGDGRKFDEYRAWFAVTLSMQADFVVFIPDALLSFARQHRVASEFKGFKTHYVVTNLDAMPLYQHRSVFDGIMKSSTYRGKMQEVDKKIECRFPDYMILIWSKFEMMKHAVVGNFFQSDWFVWIDGGLSRFFSKQELVGRPFLLCDDLPRDRLVLQGTKQTENIDWHKHGFFESQAPASGGMFAGTKQPIMWLFGAMMDILREMIDTMAINNEQIGLGIAMDRYPEKFCYFEDRVESRVCPMLLQLQDCRQCKEKVRYPPLQSNRRCPMKRQSLY